MAPGTVKRAIVVDGEIKGARNCGYARMGDLGCAVPCAFFTLSTEARERTNCCFAQCLVLSSQNRQTYNLTQALVKNFSGNKYITLNRQSMISQAQITIQRNDEQLIDNQLNTVCCPADGEEKVTTYLSCKKCNAAFPLNVDKRILHCSNCGCAQLTGKCSKRTIAKALFLKNEEQISLTIFDDKLITLHNIYNPNAKVQDSSNFTEDNVTELLLSVEATVFYNKKFNITSIKQKH